jgi:hypothetical protein
MNECDLDQEWDNYLEENENNTYYNMINEEKPQRITIQKMPNSSSIAPNCTELFISTKTRIAYFNQSILLDEVFWKIPLIRYVEQKEGVIKKQIRFQSKTPEQLEQIEKKLEKIELYDEQIITHIDNPIGRIKFKDIRKITIGISKKDIINYRSKPKKAFFNCFVMIIRLCINDIFKEFHVKVFNTGKLEIPGVSCDNLFDILLHKIIEILQPIVYKEDNPILDYKPDSIETILINSNFHCGYYLDRKILYDLLKTKYNLQVIYEPCIYPGIQCKIYEAPTTTLNPLTDINISENRKKNKKEISIMIFRTGSVLLVGNCSQESKLREIYNFIKNILITEYQHIYCSDYVNLEKKDKKKKPRAKIVEMMDS